MRFLNSSCLFLTDVALDNSDYEQRREEILSSLDIRQVKNLALNVSHLAVEILAATVIARPWMKVWSYGKSSSTLK